MLKNDSLVKNNGNGLFGGDDDMSDIEDGSLLYDAEFVNKFFELKSYADAADWINTWYR